MRSSDWKERHRELSAAGLIVQTSAVSKIETLQSVIPLIEAANSSGIRILNASTVEELLAISPPQSTDAAVNSRVLSQSTLSKSGNSEPIGRVIAPVRSSNPSTPPRPRGSSGFSEEDFPMDANEVESEIEIHFDITGNSSTEGKISDMQSCFRSRLSQIREMMLSGGALPRSCLLYTSPSPRD